MILCLDTKTPEQSQRWDAAMVELRRLEEEHRAGNDPWLFHGTSAISAAWIRREGFRPSHLLIQPEEGDVRPGEPRCAEGVNWGTVNAAQWAAERKARHDDPPVILAARLSALRKAGVLVPDHFAWSTGCTHSGSGRPYDGCAVPDGPLPQDPDWRQSLDHAGAIGVVGCARVDGMVLHEPLRNVAVHPDWERDREARKAAHGSARSGHFALDGRMPPRGMREATPATNPPTMTSGDALAAAMARRWPLASAEADDVGEAPVLAM